MALRIRKSIKIAPGVRINIGKKGISTSLGTKGATVNLSKRGARVTAGLPGTGISASQLYKSKRRLPAPTPQGEYSTAEWVVAWLMGEVMALVGWAMASGGRRFFCAAIAILIPLGLFQHYRPKRN